VETEVVRTVAIVVASFLVMEPVTALTHRFVMHGVGRRLHRSHHRRDSTGWEANDLYPVMFAAVVLVGLAIGFNVDGWSVLVPIGVGVTLYGLAYALVHDVYIHRRLGRFGGRTLPGFERLAAAHRVHHDRNGAPYGMLIPVVPGRRRPATGQVSGRASGSVSGSVPSQVPVDA
jgi:beta-carotene 3-hydroxylase